MQLLILQAGAKVTTLHCLDDKYGIKFWLEKDGLPKWYLGIVHSINSGGEIAVLHLKQNDKHGLHWCIPEKEDIWSIEEEQILLRDLNVIYHGACFNRIEISKAIVREISVKFKDF